MKSKHAHKIKKILIAFVVVKLILTLLFFSGSIDVPEHPFSDPQAIAQDKQAAPDPAADSPQDAATPAAAEKAQPEGEGHTAVVKLKTDLEGLEQKRRELDQREEELARKQAQLEALKQEIETKIAELSKIQRDINASLQALDQKETAQEKQKRLMEEEKIKRLVKLYTSMKPSKAAEIIDKLDMDVAEKIFRSMKGDQAGQILSYVNRQKAAEISERLAPEKDPNKTAGQ